MPRRLDPDRDLYKPWKLGIPATTAGRIEFLLLDRITGKPTYGARNRLVAALLERWAAEQSGRQPLPPVPSLEELLTQ